MRAELRLGHRHMMGAGAGRLQRRKRVEKRESGVVHALYACGVYAVKTLDDLLAVWAQHVGALLAMLALEPVVADAYLYARSAPTPVLPMSADTRTAAVPTLESQTIVLADAGATAFPAHVSPALVWANTSATAIFALVPLPTVRADEGSTAILTRVSSAIVDADTGATAVLASAALSAVRAHHP